jgi:putative FmdB family regulatory protein
MAKYDYKCKNCGHEFEVTQKMTDNKLTMCPKCNHDSLKRLVRRTDFILKGGGWFNGYS